MKQLALALPWTRYSFLWLVLLSLLAESTSVVVWAEQSLATPELSWLTRWHIKGRLQEELAYRLSEPQQLTKLKTIGWLEGRYDFSPAVNLKLAGRGWYD